MLSALKKLWDPKFAFMNEVEKFYRGSRIFTSSRQGMVVLLYSKVLSWKLLNTFRGKSAVWFDFGCLLPIFTLKPNQTGLFGQPENREGVGGRWGVGSWIKTKGSSPEIVTQIQHKWFQWHFGSFSFYKIFETILWFIIFPNCGAKGTLFDSIKMFSFQHKNFWKSILFHQDWQHIHQMKAEIFLIWHFMLKCTVW